MKVLKAHRKRIAEIQGSLSKIFDLRGKLFELRSESWSEQSKGDLNRAQALRDIRGQIEGVEEEIDRTRKVMVGEKDEDETKPAPV